MVREGDVNTTLEHAMAVGLLAHGPATYCAYELCMGRHPVGPTTAARRTATTMTNLSLHVLMVWTDPPYHRSPLPGCPMDPPDPCKGQVQHMPVTPTDVVAQPQPVNVHGICEAPAPTYWHLVAALLRWSED